MITTNFELPVMSSWMQLNGRRLDCNPYLSGAFEARVRLERLHVKKQPLQDLTEKGLEGIYHAGREGRTYVDNPAYGVPFLGSTDILAADFSNIPLLSKKQVNANPQFIIKEGWTLITRSGTIGRMAYVRSDMSGMACSEHVMRVVPDINKVPSGYLYAYLSSKFGVPIVIAGTYGAIIQHIEPDHIADIPVPRFGDEVEARIHAQIVSASSKRTQAIELQREGVRDFITYFNLNSNNIENKPTTYSDFSTHANQLSRLDAFHYSPNSLAATSELKGSFAVSKPLHQVAQIFSPKIFKRIYAEGPENGYPYYSGSELFQLYPESRGYLSKKAAGITNYLVKKDWLLIQDAGQVGGLIGRIVRVHPYADNSAVSNHLIRIIPKTVEDGGYIFTVLSSDHGYRAIVRHAFGTSIPQLESSHIASVYIPWPEVEIRKEIAAKTLQAWKLFDEAEEEEQSIKAFLHSIIEDGSQ